MEGVDPPLHQLHRLDANCHAVKNLAEQPGHLVHPGGENLLLVEVLVGLEARPAAALLQRRQVLQRPKALDNAAEFHEKVVASQSSHQHAQRFVPPGRNKQDTAGGATTAGPSCF